MNKKSTCIGFMRNICPTETTVVSCGGVDLSCMESVVWELTGGSQLGDRGQALVHDQVY